MNQFRCHGSGRYTMTGLAYSTCPGCEDCGVKAASAKAEPQPRAMDAGLPVAPVGYRYEPDGDGDAKMFRGQEYVTTLWRRSADRRAEVEEWWHDSPKMKDFPFPGWPEGTS